MAKVRGRACKVINQRKNLKDGTRQKGMNERTYNVWENEVSELIRMINVKVFEGPTSLTMPRGNQDSVASE